MLDGYTPHFAWGVIFEQSPDITADGVGKGSVPQAEMSKVKNSK